MIIVTGTKRSGTSMWMQILQAAGFQVLGEAFPKDWGDVIREANPEGFFESHLRNGIHFQTNPHPKTGDFIHPSESRGLAVKVFIPGLIRSDLAYLDRVLGTMRNWREYHGSLNRLYEMERVNRREKFEAEGKKAPEMVYVPPVLEWWAENYSLLSDAIRRRLPLHMVAYESTLNEPERVIPSTLEWLGSGDVDAALAIVKPRLRTHEAGAAPEVPDVEPEVAEVFDELYSRILESRGLDGDFIDRLNETNERLESRIDAEMKKVRAHRMAARRERLLEARATADAADDPAIPGEPEPQ